MYWSKDKSTWLAATARLRKKVLFLNLVQILLIFVQFFFLIDLLLQSGGSAASSTSPKNR